MFFPSTNLGYRFVAIIPRNFEFKFKMQLEEFGIRKLQIWNRFQNNCSIFDKSKYTTSGVTVTSTNRLTKVRSLTTYFILSILILPTN